MWETIQNKCVTFKATKFKIKWAPSGNWFTKKWDNKDLKLQCEKLVNLKYLHIEKFGTLSDSLENMKLAYTSCHRIFYYCTPTALMYTKKGESGNLQDTKLEREKKQRKDGKKKAW